MSSLPCKHCGGTEDHYIDCVTRPRNVVKGCTVVVVLLAVFAAIAWLAGVTIEAVVPSSLHQPLAIVGISVIAWMVVKELFWQHIASRFDRLDRLFSRLERLDKSVEEQLDNIKGRIWDLKKEVESLKKEDDDSKHW